MSMTPSSLRKERKKERRRNGTEGRRMKGKKEGGKEGEEEYGRKERKEGRKGSPVHVGGPKMFRQHFVRRHPRMGRNIVQQPLEAFANMCACDGSVGMAAE
jgi:hypothetical protein